MKSCGCLSSLRSQREREDSTRADVGTTPLSPRKFTCPIAEGGVRVGSWPDTDKEAAMEMLGSWRHPWHMVFCMLYSVGETPQK